MPVTLPPSVRQALGDPASNDFEEWMGSLLQEPVPHRNGKFKSLREEVSRLKQVDDRVRKLDARIENRLQAIEKRLDNLYDQVLNLALWGATGIFVLFSLLAAVVLAT